MNTRAAKHETHTYPVPNTAERHRKTAAEHAEHADHANTSRTQIEPNIRRPSKGDPRRGIQTTNMFTSLLTCD